MITVSKVATAVATTLILIGLSVVAQAGETRLLLKMPTANKITGVESKKSKKAYFDCAPVKTGENGAWHAVTGSKHMLFTDVPQTDETVENGTKAIRCTAKLFDKNKHKPVNADVGETAE